MAWRAPIVVFDQVVAAGALSPAVVGNAFLIPGDLPTLYSVSHAGFGSGAAGTFEVSADGVNWVDGTDLALTATTPISVLTFNAAGDARFVRFRITNGGANGGRVVISAMFRGNVLQSGR